MKIHLSIVATLLVALFTTIATSQEFQVPQPSPELDVLKADVGTWDVEIKAWAGPGEPTISKGRETNRMLGSFWLLSDFDGCMMEMDFQGHGAYSYDAEAKQYVGSWVDSLSPNKMDMVGKYDEANKTMTFEGTAPGPDGNLNKHVIETKYADDETHSMTMHVQADGEMIKIFEMKYTRAMTTAPHHAESK